MEISFIPASMYTLEEDTEEEPTVTTTAIDEMDIDTLKAQFSTIMDSVCTAYGDKE